MVVGTAHPSVPIYDIIIDNTVTNYQFNRLSGCSADYTHCVIYSCPWTNIRPPECRYRPIRSSILRFRWHLDAGNRTNIDFWCFPISGSCNISIFTSRNMPMSSRMTTNPVRRNLKLIIALENWIIGCRIYSVRRNMKGQYLYSSGGGINIESGDLFG